MSGKSKCTNFEKILAVYKQVIYNGLPINFEIKGRGQYLVLLHGYLESLEIWGKFKDILAEQFTVISIDLPGFGLSSSFSETHSMELYAEAVISVINSLGAEKFILAGHSLGGYVSLSILENYPSRLKGLCLFHSHPYPDSEQTIDKRKREICLVDKGKQELIFNINIPNAFSPHNLERMGKVINKAKAIAAKTSPKGIKAALNGMMIRPSREKLLKETIVPVLLIVGKYDNYIPYEEVGMKINLPENGKTLTLENSGHMGFLEEPELSLTALSAFAKSL
jgi:pimeloyl-ACP methyl ester carboxylesterase